MADRKYNWKEILAKKKWSTERVDNCSLLRTFVHPITFKFSSESVSWIYRGNEEWMKPNHNCNEGKSSTVEGEWKESEQFFFVSLKRPLHGIRIMDTAWPSSASRRIFCEWYLCKCGNCVGGVGWSIGFLVFFVVCWVVGMGWTFFVVC